MERSDKIDSLWIQGYRAYLEELKKEERRALAPPLQQLKSAPSPVRKKQIKEFIKGIKHDFERKRKAAGRSLFIES